MIVYDVKFQDGAKITNATNTYTITTDKYSGMSAETVQDDILSEIAQKGIYTSKAKSDDNAKLDTWIYTDLGKKTSKIELPLPLIRKQIYNGYFVSTNGGIFTPQYFFSEYIKNGIISSDIKIKWIYDGKIKEVPVARNQEELNKYIENQEFAVVKDFVLNKKTISTENNETMNFSLDLYINFNYLTEMIVFFVCFDYVCETYYLKKYSSQKIDIKGQNLDFLGLSFGESNSYPKLIKTSEGNLEPNNNAVFLKNLGGISEISLEFDEMTKPNTVISFDVFTTEIKVSRKNLISAESNISYRADKKLPSFGVLSNTGIIEFNDIDGRVGIFAENNLLKSDVKVELYIKNTLTDTREKVGEFFTDVWNYDNDNRQVSVTLKDGLEELQDITPLEILDYDPRTSKEMDLSEVYGFLLSITPQKYKFLEFYDLDTATYYHLWRTTVKFPFIKQDNLWQMWNKFCEVSGTYIYKNGDGDTVCRYAYGG